MGKEVTATGESDRPEPARAGNVQRWGKLNAPLTGFGFGLAGKADLIDILIFLRFNGQVHWGRPRPHRVVLTMNYHIRALLIGYFPGKQILEAMGSW